MPETKSRWPWRRRPKTARQGRHAGPAPAPVDPYAAGSMLPDLAPKEYERFAVVATLCPDHHPVLDDTVGWLCTTCGAEAGPDELAPGARLLTCPPEILHIAKTPGSGNHGLPLPGPGVAAPGDTRPPGPGPDGAGAWRAAYDALTPDDLEVPAVPPPQVMLPRLGRFIRVQSGGPWPAAWPPGPSSPDSRSANLPSRMESGETLQNFTGSYVKPTEYRATLQTYRDDNGPHLLVMLDDDKTMAHIKLSDSECQRLGKALQDIGQETPF